MADLSDATAYLAAQVAAAVYPNGNSSPSIAPIPAGLDANGRRYTAPMDVRIFEGWPIAQQLDLDMAGQHMVGSAQLPRQAGPCANVSIYPLPGATSAPYQILDKTYQIAAPVFGLVVAVVGNAITVTGSPGAGEFLTVVADRNFIYSSGGASASAVLSALLTQAQVNYPSSAVVGSTLTVPTAFEIDVRQGGIGTLGKVTHRQCQSVNVTVWAPDHNSRAVLAKAIDGVLKQSIVVTMPDGTEAKILAKRTDQFEEGQNVTAYRRDLVFEIEYATLETFPGTSITSVTNTISAFEYPTPATPPQIPAIT